MPLQSVIQGQVGPSTYADGVINDIRLEKTGGLVVQELHGRYYENAYRKNLFYAYSSLQTLSAVGTAMTGLILYNGATNVNLVLQKINLQVPVTSASMTGIALASGTPGLQTLVPTTTTAATKTGNCFLGGPPSQAIAYTIATTLTTAAFLSLMHNTAAINTVGQDYTQIDFEGSIIVPPNTVVCLAALGAASAASAVTSSIMWEEVPV
jgi:hypothetical protein